MKKNIIIIALGLIFCFSNNVFAISLSMDLDSWHVIPDEPGSSTMPLAQEGPDGLTVYARGYRDGSIAYSDFTTDFTNGGTVYSKWKVDPGDGYNYMGVSIGLGAVNAEHEIGYERSIGLVYHTTHHSYHGSIVVANNTWYYSSSSFDENGLLVTHTSTGDYYENGGILFHSFERLYAEEELDYDIMSNASFYFCFGDNYSGADANMTVAEVDITGSEPIPEPATMLLLGSGLMGLAGLRRRIAGIRRNH